MFFAGVGVGQVRNCPCCARSPRREALRPLRESGFVVHLAHTAAMRKRVDIALALLLVILAGVMAWLGLRSQDRSRKEYASC